MRHYRKIPPTVIATPLTWGTWDEVCRVALLPNDSGTVGGKVDAEGNFSTGTAIRMVDEKLALKIVDGDRVEIAVENDMVFRDEDGKVRKMDRFEFSKAYEEET